MLLDLELVEDSVASQRVSPEIEQDVELVSLVVVRLDVFAFLPLQLACTNNKSYA
jgi:hypothetical protein